jgi:hypothetical protein
MASLFLIPQRQVTAHWLSLSSSFSGTFHYGKFAYKEKEDADNPRAYESFNDTSRICKLMKGKYLEKCFKLFLKRNAI